MAHGTHKVAKASSKLHAQWFNDLLKVAFFRKYDAFFSFPQKCAENYPEKEILKLRPV